MGSSQAAAAMGLVGQLLPCKLWGFAKWHLEIAEVLGRLVLLILISTHTQDIEEVYIHICVVFIFVYFEMFFIKRMLGGPQSQ